MAMKSTLIINAEAGTIDRVMPSGKVRQNIGSPQNFGYIHISVGLTKKLAHRLIWEHVNGPVCDDMFIDHINGNRADNRIANLRLVTRTQNMQNQHNAREDNKSSGVKGVTWNKRDKRWQAQLQQNGKCRFLGYFSTVDEAAKAYALGAARFHSHNPHASPCQS